jgi:hypothetical protein
MVSHKQLQPRRLTAYNGPERLHLSGDHLYIDYAGGIARSKLTAAFHDKALQLLATVVTADVLARASGLCKAPPDVATA